MTPTFFDIKNSMRLWLTGIFIFLQWSFPSFAQNPQTKKDSWRAQMNQTGSAFRSIIPLAFNLEFYSEKKNQKNIEILLKKFSNSMHEISDKKVKTKVGDDPYVWLSVQDLKELSNQAFSAYKDGHFKISQDMLIASAATCFRCHTRFPKGLEGEFWKTLNVDAFSLDPVDKANLHIAMRNFNKAISNIESALEEPGRTQRPAYEVEILIKKYLFIAIRGMNSFEKAYLFLHSQKENDQISKTFIPHMRSWESDLLSWKKKEKGFREGTLLISELLKVKDDRIIASEKRDYLKLVAAASLLHRQIQPDSSKKSKAKTFLFLGQVYRHLPEESYWELPELYFETCIRYAKKTPLAKKCFQMYLESVKTGFMTTRGVPIPNFEKNKIRQLKKMSGVN